MPDAPAEFQHPNEFELHGMYNAPGHKLRFSTLQKAQHRARTWVFVTVKGINGKYIEQVNQDVADAETANIKSTPTFLINGTMIQGAQPYDVFKQAIDNELNK